MPASFQTLIYVYLCVCVIDKSDTWAENMYRNTRNVAVSLKPSHQTTTKKKKKSLGVLTTKSGQT